MLRIWSSRICRYGVLGLICVLIAASKAELKFLKQTELANAGVKFKLMPKAVELPVPRPKSRTRTHTDSLGAQSTTQVFNPHELWMIDHTAAAWLDAFGTTLRLGILKYPLPSGFGQKYVSREEFAKKVPAQPVAPLSWTKEQLGLWMTAFTGSKNGRFEAVKTSGMRLSALVRFIPSTDADRKCGLLFRFNRAAAGQTRAAECWYAMSVELGDGVNMAAAMKNVESQLVPSITVPRMSASHVVAVSSAFQGGHRSTIVEEKRSDSYEASRQQVIDSIKNSKKWWYVETEHYIVLSDLTTRHRTTVKALQRNIEYLRSAYEQFIPPKNKIKAVSVVRMPATAEEYAQYVEADLAWSSGLWSPSRGELMIKGRERGGTKDKKERMLKTANHEAFHQYIYYALDRIRLSQWYNEGHACFFGPAQVKNNRLRISEDEYRFTILEGLAEKGPIDVNHILEIGRKEWVTCSKEARAENYAVAWGLVYYLRKYVPTDRQSPYGKILDTYLETLRATRDAKKATQQALNGVDRKKLGEDLAKFWASRNMRGAAKRNYIFSNIRIGK